MTLNIAANVAEDALGNANSAATEQTVRVDMTGPTATIEVPSETQGGAFVVRVTFSEAGDRLCGIGAYSERGGCQRDSV